MTMRAAVLFLFYAASAFGWGCEGHEMIALIARTHMTPQASQEVDRLLRENPIDPSLSRFCKDRSTDLMADSSTWADDARNIEKNGDWHFIDIPRGVESGDLTQWCKADCIVSAIDTEWAILRDKRQPDGARAKALRYLIHFVGDLAQPLHATDNHDRGGNCTAITFFSGEKPENLHAIWDYKIIQRDLDAKKQTKSEYARALDTEFRQPDPKIDVVAWTWKSHRLASEYAYGALKPQIPVASPGSGTADQDACNSERASVAALHIAIDDEYVRQVLPIIREQLAIAGYRLAGLLNQTFQ